MYNPYQQNFSQMQNGGFVSVRSEMEAWNYPVKYGASVNFKDETAPYIYVKTMGLSQFDTPVFEKYRLVKEDTTTPIKTPCDIIPYKLLYVSGYVGDFFQPLNHIRIGLDVSPKSHLNSM